MFLEGCEYQATTPVMSVSAGLPWQQLWKVAPSTNQATASLERAMSPCDKRCQSLTIQGEQGMGMHWRDTSDICADA